MSREASFAEIVYDAERIGPWVCERAGGQWLPGRGTAIGLERDGELVAGVLYEDYNGANVVMHVASDGTGQWLTAEYLRTCFEYPFGQLGCKHVTGIVPSNNDKALTFDRRLGFEVEAVLAGAHPDGDLIVLHMKREKCRWIRSH
jgi:RimJ/RimL family protein N-acetyltransferase